MKSNFVFHILVVVGLFVAACSRNNQGDPAPQVPPPAPAQPQQIAPPPAHPLPPNGQVGLADNSRKAVAVIMGAPVVNTSFVVSNFNERSGICRYEAVGANANSLSPVNPEAMLYFSETIGIYPGNRSYRGCRIHEAATLQLDFSSDAILTATLSMGGEIFRGTRIPYLWDQPRRELIISNFEMRNANAQSKFGDVIEVSGSQRRVYLDEERRAYPGFRVEWQPDVSSRGHMSPQAAMGSSQLRLHGQLRFDFGKQTPSQSVNLGGSQANINVGAVHIRSRSTGGSTYFLPIAGSIMNPGVPQTPSSVPSR